MFASLHSKTAAQIWVQTEDPIYLSA
jgi:hypothetical protein